MRTYARTVKVGSRRPGAALAVTAPRPAVVQAKRAARHDPAGVDGGRRGLRDVPLFPTAEPLDVDEIARSGTSSVGAGPLPFLDRIQRSFGPGHDLGGVRAHVGGSAADAARNLGAEAYTHGERVAFGAAPNLHVAAHEAAHVVQQRRGVSLPAGVGRTGDSYERNADAVADRVVRGEPASDLLAPAPAHGGAAAGPASSAVQMYGTVAGKPYDRVSDDGKMAVKDHKRDAWALSSKIVDSNRVLDGLKSKVKLEEVAGSDVTIGANTLKKFRPVDRASSSEAELTDDCGTACQQILGADAAGYEAFAGAFKQGSTEAYTGPSTYRADDNAAGGLVSTTEQISGEIYIKIMKLEFNKTLSREDALKEWQTTLTADQRKALSKKYGINQFAAPRVGQGITIGSERDMPGSSGSGYNFHFGFNLMSAGDDYITLEDYASSGVKYYFDMYGPESKGQAWAQDVSNTGAVDSRFTAVVVQHPESLKGIVNANGVLIEADPGAPTGSKTIPKDTKVKMLRKGHSWTKIEVTDGPRTGETGWILNQFFTDT
jgi:hypothetical protein